MQKLDYIHQWWSCGEGCSEVWQSCEDIEKRCPCTCKDSKCECFDTGGNLIDDCKNCSEYKEE